MRHQPEVPRLSPLCSHLHPNSRPFCLSPQWADLTFPFCKHGKRSILRTVLKIGPNNGKNFFACPLGKENQCNFFQWAENGPGMNISPGCQYFPLLWNETTCLVPFCLIERLQNICVALSSYCNVEKLFFNVCHLSILWLCGFFLTLMNVICILSNVQYITFSMYVYCIY